MRRRVEHLGREPGDAASRSLRALAAALGLASGLAWSTCADAARPKPAPTAAVAGPADIWAASWGSSPEPARAPFVTLANQTVRQIARLSLGGIFVRIRLSNEFGDKPLVIGAAHVALATGPSGAAIQAGSDHSVTFGGKPGITIPAGAAITSDPVRFAVPPLANLSVSVFFSDAPGAVTENYFSMQTAYIASGDQTAAADLPGASTATQRLILTGVDVSAASGAKVVVALGDSLTGGFGSQMDADHRWTDHLAERLLDRRSGAPIGVVNAGIGGNRLLHDFFGPNALARFDRDVLAQPAVGYLIVLLGINDFGLPGGRNLPQEEVSADDVIQGYRQLIVRANSHGIKVFFATLPPFGPLPQRPGYYSDASEAKREAVNQWIRTNKDAQGYIDFEAALRDPKAPIRMLPQYDSADHLDPNDAGYQVMSDKIDFRLFEPSPGDR